MIFKDLKAYQHARRLAVVSRPLINRLPASERDLADQWRRACNSVVLNLAEGISRRGAKEFRRFTDMREVRWSRSKPYSISSNTSGFSSRANSTLQCGGLASRRLDTAERLRRQGVFLQAGL